MFTQTQIEHIERIVKNEPFLSYRQLAKILVSTSPLFRQSNTEVLRKQLAFYFKDKNNEGVTFEEFEASELTLPDSNYLAPTIYQVDGTIGVVSDIHLPYHDKRALQLAINYLHETNIDTLILNGDIVDFYPLSRFSRNPNLRDLNTEVKTANLFLDYLQSKFNKIVYKEGNHEVRLQHYIAEKAPELGNLEGVTLNGLFHLQQRGIEFLDNRALVRAGKLGIIHGNEINNGGIINVARVKILRAMDNLLFGHHHVTQDFTQRKLFGDIIGAWSVGCLCGLQPEYAKFNGWNHGFAVVRVSGDGIFEVENKKILNYRIL